MVFNILIGKIIFYLCKFFNLGAGGTWPGEITLRLSPDILQNFISRLNKGIIIISGTNGKTTTALMVQRILEKNGECVIHNASGANLSNGIVSAFIHKTDWLGNIKADWGVLEVDENSLPLIIKQINHHVIARSIFDKASTVSPSTVRTSSELSRTSSGPNCSAEPLSVNSVTKQSIKNGITTSFDKLRTRNDKSEKKLIIVLLNLFRDQLDRYGEVDVIAEKWQKALEKLPKDATIILNADDPLIAYLGSKLKFPVRYFGVNEPKLLQKKLDHATDSIFCMNCGSRLQFEGVYYSHIGIWKCNQCGRKRPKPNIDNWGSTLTGLYNKYNLLAAVSVAKSLNISDKIIKNSLDKFSPAFGRQETFTIDNKKINIFLSKNPTGFNVSLKTVLETNPKVLLLILNDQIPDGKDVSWIWDVDFEMIPDSVRVIVSGDRVYDLALRIKYSRKNQKSLRHSFDYPSIALRASTQDKLSGQAKIKNQNYNLKVKTKNYNLKLKTDYLSPVTCHLSHKLIIEPNLKEAINKSLESIDLKETLFILPTYSAMLEVRKILIGRKIL